ncbi:MAG: DUF2332 family protein [Elusimicrobia bacterium]|nr:DUF2332 family protein [Elusimicrobiota bacterium]
MITKEQFLAQLERATLVTMKLPVTGAMVRHLAEAVKRDPPWLAKVLKAWEKRNFVAWTEDWQLFLSAVHYEALSDEDCPLVRYFPSCGGTPEADPAPALDRFLAAAPDSFYHRLRLGHRRSYVAARTGLWKVPALLFFQRFRKLPYYLVEVNAGAGLDLCADMVRPEKNFASDLVAARIGLDPEPLLLSDISHRRWLTAAVPPDNMRAIEEMDQAADVVLDLVSRDASFLQLVACPAEHAPRFIAKNIPPDEDVGLLVFNMATTGRMNDEDYAAYRAGMAETLKPWGDRGLWAEVESVRGELYSTTFQLRINRCRDGMLQQHIATSIDFAASQVSFNTEETAKFLVV